MGGTDCIDNLIELTLEEHAEAHRILFETYGSVFDKIAWKALSGQITMSEAAKQAKLAGCKLGGLLQPKEAKSRGGKNNTYKTRLKAARARFERHGHLHENLSEESYKRYVAGRSAGGKIGGKKGMAVLQKMRYKCNDCGYISTPRWVKHHIKKEDHSGFEVIK